VLGNSQNDTTTTDRSMTSDAAKLLQRIRTSLEPQGLTIALIGQNTCTYVPFLHDQTVHGPFAKEPLTELAHLEAIVKELEEAGWLIRESKREDAVRRYRLTVK
jgi:hypothetical protein